MKAVGKLIDEALSRRPWMIRGAWYLYGRFLDWRYAGVSLGRVTATKYPELGAHAVGSTSYRSLPRLLESQLRANDVFVDVGCGQGRPFVWLLHKGYRSPMIGLELDPEVAAQTSRRFARFANIVIVPGDAIENLPDSGTLFYMYNPFDRDVMQRFKRRVELKRPDTEVRVIYHNGVHVDVFREDPTWSVVELDSGAGGHPAFLLRRESTSV